MNVDKVLELPDGKVTFQGELSASEVQAIISVGLNTLLSKGAMPYIKKDEHTLAPYSETQQ